jgi:hypothetical protein
MLNLLEINIDSDFLKFVFILLDICWTLWIFAGPTFKKYIIQLPILASSIVYTTDQYYFYNKIWYKYTGLT